MGSTTDGGAQSQDVRVVKAGGIDLIDLMKEGLLAPAENAGPGGVFTDDRIEEPITKRGHHGA